MSTAKRTIRLTVKPATAKALKRGLTLTKADRRAVKKVLGGAAPKSTTKRASPRRTPAKRQPRVASPA